MPLIPDPKTVEYLRRFGVAAVFVARTAGGHIDVGAALDLKRALGSRQLLAVWWTQGNSALTLARAAAVALPAGATQEDAENAVRETASRMQIQLADHDTTITRAQAALGRLRAGIEQAKDRGLVKFFNREFRKRRVEAAAAGKNFLSYATAYSRLQLAIVDAASDGASRAEILSRVFDR